MRRNLLNAPLALAAAMIALAASPSRLHANWLDSGCYIGFSSFAQPGGGIWAANNGGVVAWVRQGGAGPSNNAYRASSLTPEGNDTPLWDIGWIENVYALAPDELGGLYRAGHRLASGHYDTFLIRVKPEGGLADGWPTDGRMVTSTTTTDESYPTVASDLSGNAIVAYLRGSFFDPHDVVVKRVLPGSQIDPAWPAAGVLVNAYQGIAVQQKLSSRSDGEGGVYVGWQAPQRFIQRVTSTGAIAAGWPEGGLPVSGSESVTAPGFESLISGGPDHIIACWSEGAGGLWLQRVHKDGALDPNWSDGGLQISPSVSGAVSIAPDGAGGAFAAWISGTDVRGAHVLSDGTFDPAWPPGGKSLLGPGNVAYGPGAMVVAPGPNGGLIVLWSDTAVPNRRVVRARWLDSAGNNDATQPPSGREVSPLGTYSHPLAVTSDGDGGAYVLWHDFQYEFDTTAARYVSWMPYPQTSVGVESGIRPRFALERPYPNPSSGAIGVRFTLATPDPARLELLDLAGRRVASRDISGAGSREERFSGSETLAPGLYVVRLTQGAQTRTARVAVVR